METVLSNVTRDEVIYHLKCVFGSTDRISLFSTQDGLLITREE